MRIHRAFNSKRNLYCLFIVSVLITLISGASVYASSSEQKTLTLFVAAGMKKPMDAVIEKYKTEKGVEAIPNYGSSGQLWAQIRQGQPCDVYFSADWIYIEKAQSEDKLTQAKKFLSDNIVLVIAPSAAEKVKSLKDLTRTDVTFALGDAQAPVGLYAEKGLKSLGLWEKAAGSLRARPSTVNQVAIMVKEDQVDAGLIFSSVANGNKLKIIEVMDQKDTGEIVFGVGLVKGGNESLSRDFMDYAFKNINEFTKYGWKPYE